MQERRTEVRMLCADMVEVSWLDQAGRQRRTTGILEDISASGALPSVGDGRAGGRADRWRSPEREFTAYVRYCVYREIGYFVGVEFNADSQWSKKVYRPQHLLDLKKLMG